MDTSPKRYCSLTREGVSKKQRYNFSKHKLIKNLLVISFSFMMSFCASDGLTVLQSTMNSENGVGVISSAIKFACGCLCALILPKYFLKKFGSKVVIVLSMLTYVPFLASNFYPHFSLMIPTSIIVGFGSSLVWGSLGTYLNDLSLQYYSLSSDDIEQVSDNKTQKHNPHPLSKEIPITSNRIQRHMDGDSVTDPCKHFIELSFNNPEMHKNRISISSAFKTVSNSKKIGKLKELVKESNSVDFKVTENDDTCLETNKNYCLTFPMIKKLSLKTDKSNVNNDGKLSVIFSKSNEQVSLERLKTNFSWLKKKDLNKSENSQTIMNSKSLETITARCFGIFGLVYQTSHIWSNVISYFTLLSQSGNIDYARNSSCTCGSNFCSSESLCFKHNIQIPSDATRYILTTVYVLMGLLSALCVALFVDQLTAVEKEVTFSLNFALATCKLQKKKNQLLLVPISFYLGMLQAFLLADFTKDFVGCAWGVNHVALVSISLGCGISLSCGLVGWLEKHLGRQIIFSCIVTINVGVFAYMLTWTPDSSKPALMFVIALILGFVDGSLWCQTRAFIGIVFKEEQEAAFGSYQFWYGLGSAVCFAYSNFICTYIKIWLLLTVISISIVGYLLVERNHSLNKNNK